MLKFFRDQKGFTLVELMIVVVIVGILAAVAVPMYRGSTDRAKASEAVAALGSIRSAMRVYYGEHGTYLDATNFMNDSLVTKGGILGINESDLLGRYFSAACYTFHGLPTTTTFDIEALGSASGSTAPEKAGVSSIVRYIDEAGAITQ